MSATSGNEHHQPTVTQQGKEGGEIWVLASKRMPRAKARVKWRWAATFVEVEYAFVRELFKGYNDHKTKFEWLDESPQTFNLK